MEKINLPEQQKDSAYNFLQPSRPVLVTTLEEDQSTHVAPFSWIMPLSVNPFLVGLALLAKPRKQHSLINIENHGEFAANIPGLELAEKLVLCSYKVKPGVKKVNLAGLTVLPAHKIKPGLIAECRAHLECRVLSIADTGDHRFITAEVIHVSYDRESYNSDLTPDLNRFMPCVHLTNYKSESGQAHLFFRPGGVSVFDVPYVER
ncbi:MAG TPA: flavin reductase family protein [Bacillota bacterium]|nr:flavin reductase family protein [Bacillota bacterium]